MLQTVDVGRRSLKAYRGVAPEPLLDAFVPRARAVTGPDPAGR